MIHVLDKRTQVRNILRMKYTKVPEHSEERCDTQEDNMVDLMRQGRKGCFRHR